MFSILAVYAELFPSLTTFAAICSRVQSESGSDLSAAKKIVVGAGDVLCSRALNSVGDYICQWLSRLEVRLLEMLATSSSLTVIVSWSECGTAYTG